MHWLLERFSQFGNKAALVEAEASYSYQDLYEQVLTYKKQLAEQLAPNQLVALISDYNFHSIASFLALYLHQSLIIPLATQNEDELNKRLKVIQANYLLSINNKTKELKLSQQDGQHNFALLKKLQAENQPGLVLFSSGSTGEPKAMVHNLENLISSYAERKTKNLNILLFLMFDHIGGLNTLLNSLAMGAKIVLPANRSPELIAKLIEEHQIQVLPASPTFLNLMLLAKVEEKYNLSSLRLITYGTEPMPASLLGKLKLALPKTKLLQTFGTSETGIAQTASRSSSSLELKINDPNTQYKIVDGELWLKSSTQILGYLNASMENFTEDGWFKTGDLVEEKDGYLQIKGRNNEVINVGGEKVLPQEIEDVILQLPQIQDVTAYPEKNAITGQMVAVKIQLKEELPKQEVIKLVRSWCRKHLDAYKVPVKIELTDQASYGERFKKQRNLTNN